MFALFRPYSQIHCALSAGVDGSMSLVDLANTQKNRSAFLKKIGVAEDTLVSARLVHGNTVARVGQNDRGRIVDSVDGLITNTKGIALSVTVADCLPIFLFNPVGGAIGLVHAGWPGLSQKILDKAIEQFEREFGSNPSQLLVGIGPSIGVCHFEVHEDVASKFRPEYADAIVRREGVTSVDLKNVARLQLERTGVSADHIESSSVCTACDDRYLSHRRDKIVPIETMMAVMILDNK